jgi:hypothetical protein
MIAFAFTRAGAVSPFTGLRWPTPADGSPGAWFPGPHACRAAHLPVWIAAELWRIELEGVVGEFETRVFADRGRLRARIDAWDEAAAAEFAGDCGDQVQRLVSTSPCDPAVRGIFRQDATSFAEAAHANVAGYVAMRAAEHVGGPSAAVEERRRQARWIASRLNGAVADA